MIHQASQDAGLSGNRVLAVARFSGIAVTQHVDGDDAKACFSKTQENFAPDESRRSETVNQDQRRSFRISGLLVMNADAVEVYETGMVGMKNDVAVTVPVGVARSHEQLTGNGENCGASDPVTFLQMIRAIRVSRYLSR